uniref:Radiation-inducible immediate-early gene IEX-1 n=1 Tax=Scleropages formosus TaxID=113540 RepID=A0A8C9W845_SCLFO
MTVFARSDSLVLSIPSSSTSSSLYTEHFAFSQMPRSREPEIFTFEESPAAIPQPHRSASLRQRRKITRVMYPSKVRKYLPPAEKSPVKRWLIILCLVVCVQIYAEEGYTTESPAADSAAPDTTTHDDVRVLSLDCCTDVFVCLFVCLFYLFIYCIYFVSFIY